MFCWIAQDTRHDIPSTPTPFWLSAGQHNTFPRPLHLSGGQHNTFPWPLHLSGGQHNTFPRPLHLSGGQHNTFPRPLHLSVGQHNTFPRPLHLSVGQHNTFPRPLHLSGGQHNTFPRPLHLSDFLVGSTKTVLKWHPTCCTFVAFCWLVAQHLQRSILKTLYFYNLRSLNTWHVTVNWYGRSLGLFTY